MKVEDRRLYNNYKRFGDIDCGICFEWDYDVFIKVKDSSKSYAVALHSGNILSFSDDDKVILLKNVKVVIEE